LAESAPSPIVELNRAVAGSMAYGAAAGLELVDAIRPSLRSRRTTCCPPSAATSSRSSGGSTRPPRSWRGLLPWREVSPNETCCCSGREPPMRPRWPPRTPLPEHADRLADLDQVTIRIADICADLAPVILGLGEKLDALGRPLRVQLPDVRDSNIQECTRAVGIGRNGQRD